MHIKSYSLVTLFCNLFSGCILRFHSNLFQKYFSLRLIRAPPNFDQFNLGGLFSRPQKINFNLPSKSVWTKQFSVCVPWWGHTDESATHKLLLEEIYRKIASSLKAKSS